MNGNTNYAAPYTEAEQELYGLRPVTDGGIAFCGVEEDFAINGVTLKWPKTIQVITWGINFSRLGTLSDMDFKDAATTWLREIEEACDRIYRYVADPGKANLLYTKTTLDGRNGVLANMQLPYGNIHAGTQLVGKFDDSEGWVLSDTPQQGEIDAYRTGLHETLHFEGLGHAPADLNKPALIAPMYSLQIRHLQAADTSELQRRRGKPVVNPVPADPVNPTLGKPIEIYHKTTQDGKEWSGGPYLVPRTK